MERTIKFMPGDRVVFKKSYTIKSIGRRLIQRPFNSDYYFGTIDNEPSYEIIYNLEEGGAFTEMEIHLLDKVQYNDD